MTTIEKQIQGILNNFASTDIDKYILGIELRLLVTLAIREQMKEDHKNTLEVLGKILEMFEKTLERLNNKK